MVGSGGCEGQEASGSKRKLKAPYGDGQDSMGDGDLVDILEDTLGSVGQCTSRVSSRKSAANSNVESGGVDSKAVESEGRGAREQGSRGNRRRESLDALAQEPVRAVDSELIESVRSAGLDDFRTALPSGNQVSQIFGLAGAAKICEGKLVFGRAGEVSCECRICFAWREYVSGRLFGTRIYEVLTRELVETLARV